MKTINKFSKQYGQYTLSAESVVTESPGNESMIGFYIDVKWLNPVMGRMRLGSTEVSVVGIEKTLDAWLGSLVLDENGQMKDHKQLLGHAIDFVKIAKKQSYFTLKGNMANEFKKQYSEVSELMIALDEAGVESEQDWENETTVWTFEDGSKIKINNNNIELAE